jgi:hypothetical protein
MLHSDFSITLAPGVNKTPDDMTRFRWGMNVALPYPFPSRECIRREVVLGGMPFTFEVHNHLDRVTLVLQASSGAPSLPHVLLVDKGAPTPARPGNCVSMSREPLQSVAVFSGTTDFASHADAYSGARDTIEAGLDWLSSYLAACQRDAPYLSAWQVYPISLFDVGTVFHEVKGYCSARGAWLLVTSGVHVSMGKQLDRPTFFLDPPAQMESTSPIDTANELLAEALMSLYRGMPRLTVLNSYGAVEAFANVVYSKTRVAQLVANHVLEGYATNLVEEERAKHRTEGAFLYHRGIKDASGRSLMEENKPHYDELLKLQQVRHRVAHAGYRPTIEEARNAHTLCCECTRWLADVGGFPVKPMLPDRSSSASAISVTLTNTCGL